MIDQYLITPAYDETGGIALLLYGDNVLDLNTDLPGAFYLGGFAALVSDDVGTKRAEATAHANWRNQPIASAEIRGYIVFGPEDVLKNLQVPD